MTDVAATAPTAFDKVIEFIRREYEAPDLPLTPSTTLADLAKRDPEEFANMLEGVERVFGIRRPRLINPWRYLKALWRFQGFQIGSFVRLLDKRAIVDFGAEYTLADLCAAIDTGRWPSSMIVPPGAIEDGLVDNG